MSNRTVMLCPKCGAEMNRHASIEDEDTGVALDIYACPQCGAAASCEVEEG